MEMATRPLAGHDARIVDQKVETVGGLQREICHKPFLQKNPRMDMAFAWLPANCFYAFCGEFPEAVPYFKRIGRPSKLEKKWGISHVA